MSLAPPESAGPLRRERLRTARLYFVCEAMPRGADPEPLLRAALAGGADIVQLRDRGVDRDLLERSARTFRRLCDTHGALFVVNDDPYLARAVGADGVHVGQDDMPVEEAREILGAEMIIGLSTHSKEQLAVSEDADMRRAGTSSGLDYVSAGPIWETPTKQGRPGVGLDYIRHAAEHASRPLFAIGGIDTTNAAEVVAAGARRLCVVRAIRDADDPLAAAQALRAALAPAGGAAPGG